MHTGFAEKNKRDCSADVKGLLLQPLFQWQRCLLVDGGTVDVQRVAVEIDVAVVGVGVIQAGDIAVACQLDPGFLRRRWDHTSSMSIL